MTQIQEEEEKKVLGIHQMCMVPLSELQQDKMLSMLSKMFRMFKMLTKHSVTRVSHLKLKISPAAKTPKYKFDFLFFNFSSHYTKFNPFERKSLS